MASRSQGDTVEQLLDMYGRTYADEAGIRLGNTPQPLYRLLVMSLLLSARISSGIALATARALSDAGLRSPQSMAQATWLQRVHVLGTGGYRRYDERTSRQLGEGAEALLERYHGDLRRLRDEADGDRDELRRLLQQFPGMGPVGADIFLREVQDVWPEAAPYLDGKAQQGARKVGLPDDPVRLARLAGNDPARFAAALVRVSLDRHAELASA